MVNLKNKMIKIFLLSFSLATIIEVNGQPEWKLTPTIERNAYTILEGSIDNKYPIEMYLEYTWNWCGESDNNRWNPRILKGWYLYKKIGKRIPLIGSIDLGGSRENTLKLFVPESIMDTLDSKTCLPAKFKEMFLIPSDYYRGYYSLDTMQWSKYGQDNFLQAYLKETHTATWKTTVTLTLQVDGIDLVEFDLSNSVSNEYIDYLNIEASKEINGVFYFIIRWNHPTIPGSRHLGHCGAGQEGWIGFLELNNSLEISRFEYFQSESCLKFIDTEYSFEVEHPEKGIIMKKY